MIGYGLGTTFVPPDLKKHHKQPVLLVSQTSLKSQRSILAPVFFWPSSVLEGKILKQNIVI